MGILTWGADGGQVSQDLTDSACERNPGPSHVDVAMGFATLPHPAIFSLFQEFILPNSHVGETRDTRHLLPHHQPWDTSAPPCSQQPPWHP